MPTTGAFYVELPTAAVHIYDDCLPLRIDAETEPNHVLYFLLFAQISDECFCSWMIRQPTLQINYSHKLVDIAKMSPRLHWLYLEGKHVHVYCEHVMAPPAFFRLPRSKFHPLMINLI